MYLEFPGLARLSDQLALCTVLNYLTQNDFKKKQCSDVCFVAFLFCFPRMGIYLHGTLSPVTWEFIYSSLVPPSLALLNHLMLDSES